METRFAVEAKERLGPIMSDDLATYVEGLGEMFREIEAYAREDDGPVYVVPASERVTAQNRNVVYTFYYAPPTRGDVTWDTSVLIGGKPTIKVASTGWDTGGIGLVLTDVPIVGGANYSWRATIKGTPGKTLIPLLNTYDAAMNNVGQLSEEVVIPASGLLEVDFRFTTPPTAVLSHAYFIDSLAQTTPTTWWVSSDVALRRQSTAPSPAIPWSKITNPELAINEAALLWLAQLAGVRVPVGLKFSTMQEFIERAEARRRGRLDYMVELAQSSLTGNKRVFTIERVDGNAYRLRFVTRTSETPDPAATEALIRSAKPAGIVLEYEHVAGVTWDEAVSQWNATGLTWDESVDNVP